MIDRISDAGVAQLVERYVPIVKVARSSRVARSNISTQDTTLSQAAMKTMIAGHEPVAVHYNFATRQLSIRQIWPTGKLGSLIASVNEACLKDAVFTTNEARWRRWRDGSKAKVRQFAEIRGILLRDLPQDLVWQAVTLNPRQSPDFMSAGSPVTKAAFVRVIGREIEAALIEKRG